VVPRPAQGHPRRAGPPRAAGRRARARRRLRLGAHAAGARRLRHDLGHRAQRAGGRDRGLGDVRVGRLEQLPWPDESFDLITCLDVIEHTPDDRVTLAELRRVCRPGGWLLVTVPAYQALWSGHDEANHHYRRYSRPALRGAARAAGWDVVRMSSFNSVLLAPAAAVRLAARRRAAEQGPGNDLEIGPTWLNSALEFPLALEAGWLRRGRTLPFGLSLMAVLQRPTGGS
jgi:SAM-dependent methyltransferase